MDDVQFENWKQTITETLARTTVLQEQAAERAQAADRRMDRFERNLVRLAWLGLKARSRLNRRQEEHERRQQEHEANMARIELTLAEIGDKLNGLIGHVQGQNPTQQ